MTSQENSIDETQFEIISDPNGGRVWINGADGSSIGRFNKARGIDVHRTATDQMDGMGECLFCTHEPAGESEWNVFREAMKRYYDIDVPADLLSFGEKKLLKAKP